MKLSREEIWAQAPRMSITVDAVHPEVENPDGERQSLTVFRVFATDVSDEEGKAVGSIGGGTGYVTINHEGKEWLISHKDLWYAFMEALA